MSKEICQYSGKCWVQQERLEQVSGISVLLSLAGWVGLCQSKIGCVYAQDDAHNLLSLVGMDAPACSERPVQPSGLERGWSSCALVTVQHCLLLLGTMLRHP